EEAVAEATSTEPAEATTEEAQEQQAEEVSQALYQGTIELAIPPPVGLDRMLQLHKNLRHIPQIEVMNLGVSRDKGITIRIFLDSPIPLLKILGDLPEVDKVSDPQQGSGKAATAQQAGDKPRVKRIVVTTQK
ncbi:MAG: hypothetical protein WBC89_05155, partial [Dehalococcoidia bacterium]